MNTEELRRALIRVGRQVRLAQDVLDMASEDLNRAIMYLEPEPPTEPPVRPPTRPPVEPPEPTPGLEIPRDVGFRLGEPDTTTTVTGTLDGQFKRITALEDPTPTVTHYNAHGAEVSKITIQPPPGGSEGSEQHWFSLTVKNEKNAKSPVMLSVPTGSIEQAKAGLDWTTRPAAEAGLLAFHACMFEGMDDAFVWAVDQELTPGGKKAPAKMALHPEGRHDMWLDNCHLGFAQEHNRYGEWCRKLHIENCVFGRNGGASIQEGNRRGRLDVPGYSEGFMHGNPFHIPAGLGGWALIRGNQIDGRNIWSRKASDITFAGFLGPIYLINNEMVDGFSGVAIYADTHKGAYLVGCKLADAEGPAHSVHYVSDSGQAVPDDGRICPLVVIDGLSIDGRGHDNREQVMISGVEDVRIGRFRITGGKPAIVIDAQYGGPFRCGKVRFYDQDSVQDHLGRIGTHDPVAGRFRAYTEEELADLMAY